MLITQCPRCQESVSVPDSLCSGHASSASVQAQCPWCLAKLDAKEIQAALPPALVILGDEGHLSNIDDTPAWSDDASNSNSPGGLGVAGLATAGLGAAVAGAAVVADQVRDASGFGESEAQGLGAFESQTHDPHSLESVAELPGQLEDSPELATETTLDEVEELAPSQLDTVEELDPVDFGGSIEDMADDGSELDEMDLVANLSEEDDQLDATLESEQASGSLDLGPMMDVDGHRRRRKKSGPGIGSIIGVAAGGLLSLPIVAGVLHVMGKPVPVVGDLLEEYLPMGNKTTTSRSAAPLQPFDPPALIDDEPVQGRSLAEDLSDEEMMNEAAAPALDALAEISGADAVDSQLGGQPGLDSQSGTNGFGSPEPDMSAPEMSDPNVPEPIEPGPSESDPAPTDDNGFGMPELPTTEDAVTAAKESVPDDVFGAADNGPGFAMPEESPAAEDSTSAPENSNESDLFGAMPSDSDNNQSEMDDSAEAPTGIFGAETPDLFNPEPASPSYDVAAEVAGIQATMDTLATLPGSERELAVQNLYESISAVAGNATPDSLAPAQVVLKRIASDMSLVKAFAMASPEWIAQPAADRKTDGALVVGKLSGEPGNASILLSSKEYMPVDLPADANSVPSGIQVGLGRVVGAGESTTISLDLLQGLQP